MLAQCFPTGIKTSGALGFWKLILNIRFSEGRELHGLPIVHLKWIFGFLEAGIEAEAALSVPLGICREALTRESQGPLPLRLRGVPALVTLGRISALPPGAPCPPGSAEQKHSPSRGCTLVHQCSV